MPDDTSPVSHEDIRRHLTSGGKRFDALEEAVKKLATAVEEGLKPLPKMQRDIAATKGIVEAWNTAQSMTKFVKWASGWLIALAGMGAVLKAWMKGWI